MLALLSVVAGGCVGGSKLSTPTSEEAPSPDRLMVAAHPRGEADVQRIWDVAEHVLEPHAPDLGTHRLVLSPAALATLRQAGVPVQIEPIDVKRWIERLAQPLADQAAGPPLADQGAVPLGPFFTKVQELPAIESYLDELAGASQGRATVMSIGKSIQGRDLKVLRIAGPGASAMRPAVVVLGGQHAREWAGPVVALGLADRLVRLYESDPRVRRVVDQLQIYINPVNNPDGYVATFDGRRLQRKNMNPTCNVDLNRNYPTAFGQGTPSSCNAETYPGKLALSEPESQAVANLIGSLARPSLMIDYHSTASQVMIPYAYTTKPPPNLEKNQRFCELYSTTLREVRGTNYPARPGYRLAQGAGGGIFDWFREKHGESIVVELGGGSFTLPSAQVAPFAEENFRAWLAVAELVADDKPAPGDAGSPADAATADSALIMADATAPSSPPDTGIPSTPPQPPSGADAASYPSNPPSPGGPPGAQPNNLTGGGIGCALAPSPPAPPAAPVLLLAALAALIARRRR